MCGFGPKRALCYSNIRGLSHTIWATYWNIVQFFHDKFKTSKRKLCQSANNILFKKLNFGKLPVNLMSKGWPKNGV